MGILNLLSEAWGSLGKNKVRASLSALGVIIGVASVITMVAIGEGTKERVEREIEALGDDWMFIRYVGTPRAGVRDPDQQIPPLQTLLDSAAITRESTTIRAATPTNGMGVQVISSYKNYRSRCTGARPAIFDIGRYRLERGRPYDEQDEATLATVCCIGQTTARELFGAIDPVGESIRVNKIPFTVIGLLAPKGRSADGRDYDDIILFPWCSFQRKVAGLVRSETIVAAARPGVPIEDAKIELRAILRERHHRGPDDLDDFRMIDFSETADIKAQASESFSILLLLISSVSLVVGGVGIMNIMLTCVSERTNEIGLRMAIGANQTTILLQFLIESVVLCAGGGLFGVALGIGVAELLSKYAGYTTIIPAWSLCAAIGVSLGVGIFFGFYPAWRASQLDPITALRHE
jgi:putative ABC transport system permease protein